MNFSDPEFMQYVVKSLTIGQLEHLYEQWYTIRITKSQKHIMEPVDSVTKKARKPRKLITLKEIKEFGDYLEQQWPN